MNEIDNATTSSDNYPNSSSLGSSRKSEVIKQALKLTSLILPSVIATLLISKLLATNLPPILAYSMELLCFTLFASLNRLILTCLFGGSPGLVVEEISSGISNIILETIS